MINLLKTINGYTIRALNETPDECAAVLAVYRQCEDFLALGPVAIASPEMVQADFALSRAQGCTFCGIYSPAGDMVGVVDFSTDGFHGDPQTAYLSLLMIGAPQRGRGLGAQVVAAVEAEMRRAGQARSAAAGVQVNNPAAVHFWQRMGFAVVSAPEQQADGTITYRLHKDL